jgi:uncharacterized membrane protein
MAEFGAIGLGAGVSYAGFRVYGRERILFFLAGSILWTSIIENLGVWDQSYTYYTYAGLFGSWYPGYVFWIGLVPLWVEMGWIVVALSLFILFHEVILPGRHPVLQAALAGLFAVNIDVLIDPVAVANNLWRWITPAASVLGVPLYNWAGWFLLIFFYDLLFNYTVMRNRPVFILGGVEGLLLKDRYSKGAKAARFAFRLVVTILFIAVLLTVVARGIGVVTTVLGVA